MEIIAGFLLVFFIAMSIIVNVLYRSAKKSKHQQSYVMPDLGVQGHDEAFCEGFQELFKHLENSLQESYVERVKERVIREHRIHLTEWENRFFEWKRYLIMAALLKRVPMFSREVNEIWHEMRLYAREYEDFCKCYLKTALPNPPHVPDPSVYPQEKAWFDIIYVLLFKPTPYSIQTWGAFLREPLSTAFVDELMKSDAQALAEKYFNVHAQLNLPGVARLVRHLIRYIKKQLEEIEKHAYEYGTDVYSFRENPSFYPKNEDWALWIASGVFFLSYYYPDSFHEQYVRLFGKPPNGDHGFGFVPVTEHNGNLSNSLNTKNSKSGPS